MTTPIHVDIQALQRPETAHRGIGRYVIGLVRGMLERGLPVVGLGLNPDLPALPSLPPDLRGSALLGPSEPTEVASRVGGGRFVHLVTSPLGVADVPTEAVFPPWMSELGARRVTVVYDLIPYLFPEHYAPTDSDRRFLDERRDGILESELLLAISDSTRDDLMRHWAVGPESVVTIGAPAGREFSRPAGAELPSRRGRRYVLAPIGYEWRKEPSVLIEGWSRVPSAIRRRRRLVLVGEAPDEVRAGWVSAARDFGLRGRSVVTTGRVDDDELRALYRGAELVVHASRYEGFGLPVVEASQCGAPSITSDRGALPEILDCPDSLFDPDDPDSVAGALTRALDDPGVRARLTDAAAAAATRSEADDIGGRVAAALARLDAT